MILKSLELAKQFAKNSIKAEKFAEEYFDIFREDRDAGRLKSFPQNEILTSIFCALDGSAFYNAPDFEATSADTLQKQVAFLVDVYESGANLEEISQACTDVVNIK